MNILQTYIQLNDLDEYGRTQKDQACLVPKHFQINKSGIYWNG